MRTTWVPAALLLGAIAGAGVHVIDTAPAALSAAPGILRMVMSLGLVLVLLAAGIRAVMRDDPALVAAIPAFAVAGALAYPLGPTWVPGATVAGRYELAFPESGVSVQGALECRWRPGRYRLAAFDATGPASLPDGERVVLHASLTGRVVWLERATGSGAPRVPYADGRITVLEPPRDASLAPQRTADGRAGRTELVLAADPSGPRSTAADAAWTAPLAFERNGTVGAVLRWDCDRP